MDTKMSDAMDVILKELGMEEEFRRMAERYSADYMVPGEATEDLREILRRAPEPLLELIWESTGTGEEISDRRQKEAALYEAIPASLRREFTFLNENQIVALTKTAALAEMTETELLMVSDVTNRFGWTFTFLEDESSCCNTMPVEVKRVMKELAADEDKMAEKRSCMTVRVLLHACVNLYGVFDMETFYRVMKSVSKEEEWEGNEEEIHAATESLLEEIQKREHGWWRDGKYIITDDLKTKAEYKAFLGGVESREYYIPSGSEITKYAVSIIDTEAAEYRSVKNALTDMLRDHHKADIWMLDLETLAAEKGGKTQEIMDELYRKGLTFPTVRRTEAFVTMLREWIYKMRCWRNRGFTDEELGKNVPYAAVFIPPAVKKIGRNDPCPCGSGKKYKKCCGK